MADAFTRSESIAKLVEAMAKAQMMIKGAAKGSENPHFRSRYADLASHWEACREALSTHGLAVIQPVATEGQRVTVTTLLAHSSGEWLTFAASATAAQPGPQALGSVITYLRRYTLSAAVGTAPEDDDGEAAEKREPAKPVPRKDPEPSPEELELAQRAKQLIREMHGEDRAACIETMSRYFGTNRPARLAHQGLFLLRKGLEELQADIAGEDKDPMPDVMAPGREVGAEG